MASPFSEVSRRGQHEAGFILVHGAFAIGIELGPLQKLDEGECFFPCEVCRHSNALGHRSTNHQTTIFGRKSGSIRRGRGEMI